MTVERIRLTLQEPEYSALVNVAQSELRPVEHQARYMIRAELRRRGFLLEEDVQEDVKTGEVRHDAHN